MSCRSDIASSTPPGSRLRPSCRVRSSASWVCACSAPGGPGASAVTVPEHAISVVVVNHGTPQHLERCLETLHEDEPASVVVVDTTPDPSAVRALLRRFAGAKPLEMPNHGYGAALNAGLRLTDTPYALLLNADTIVRPGGTRSLAAFLDAHPRAAVVGPLIVAPDGSRERSAFRFPTPAMVLLQESGLHRLLRDGTAIRRTDWVLGAALAVRRTALHAVGGFDESFFLYNEEVDLCVRLTRGGWDVVYAPIATVEHVGGASTAAPVA